MALLSILKKSKARALPAGEADIDLGESYVELQQAKPSRLTLDRDMLKLLTGLPVLLLGLILSLLALYFLVTRDAAQASRDTRYIEQSSQLLLLSQRLAKDSGCTALTYAIMDYLGTQSAVILDGDEPAADFPATDSPAAG